MHEWAQGYVSDIEYRAGYYHHQMPSLLDEVCLLNAVEPPVKPGQPFDYCELGCGLGESARIVAAVSPESRVFAYDFNPAQIARARDWASEGGLANVLFEEASFEELAGPAGDDLPRFDYVSLHGVWSWVSLANRRHILRFLERHVKPGGVVAVTYNALPGWTAFAPVQRMMVEIAGGREMPSQLRLANAIELIEAFHDAGSPIVSANILSELRGMRDRGDMSYLAHEFLNDDWAPAYHHQVAAAMSTAKLDYVGSSHILDNFADLSLTAAQRDAVSRVSPLMTETARDFFQDRIFRRDVYVRGRRRIDVDEVDRRISEIGLLLARPLDENIRKLRVPIGEIELNEGFYGPAFEALARGPCSIGDLLELAKRTGSTVSAREILGLLAGSDKVWTLAEGVSETALASARNYNLALTRRAAQTKPRSLAAPGGACAVTVDAFGLLGFRALLDGVEPRAEALAHATWARMNVVGETLTHKGEPIADPEENLRLLRQHMEPVARSVDAWRTLGIL
jgi:SAM-dependent methyltransferase